MSSAALLALLLALAADPPATFEQRLREINVQEAKTWELFLDAEHQVKAEFLERPIYLWSNPTKGAGQYGSVFLWVHDGRPAAVGSFFGHPFRGDERRMVHEFHALARAPLHPVCTDGDAKTWTPKAGITLGPLPESPPPEPSSTKRLLQMRNLGRQFGGYMVNFRQQRWELRLLPQPLYRYDKPPEGVIDGALLALVSDAGTDPEVLLLIEAREPSGWQYALLRFSDSSAYVTHQGKEIWTAVKDNPNFAAYNADHTYRVLQKRLLTEPAAQPDKPAP
ncbi:MAG TPA: hypothetical protein VFB80_09455 [Pirellulaceae bacterium]|nr:hypothetical protein [Pirellulaceae bacterium]